MSTRHVESATGIPAMSACDPAHTGWPPVRRRVTAIMDVGRRLCTAPFGHSTANGGLRAAGRPARTPGPAPRRPAGAPATAARASTKPVERVEPEAVLARARGSRFLPRWRCAQDVERVEVVGAVDDPEVLPAAHLEPGLDARPSRRRGAAGLTTMPSPPAAVRSSHHCAASARCSAEERSTKRCRVGVITLAVEQRPAASRCHGVRLGDRQRPALGGQDLERRQGDAVEAVGRAAVRRVGVAERLGVVLELAGGAARPGRRPRGRGPRPASSSRPSGGQGRAGPRRRPRRTGRGSARSPWPTRAAARSRATSQSVSSDSNSGAAAARSRADQVAIVSVSSKNGRPVRV